MKHTFSYLLILFIAACSIIVSCTTEKNTLTTRTYHNLTARYNVYFNGNEAFKSGIQAIEKNHKEPYNSILPIFIFSDKDALSVASSDMDRAIDKSVKLIQEHSITKKPKTKKKTYTPKEREFYNRKEYNNWVDNAHLLMGKALFFKQEYSEAEKHFSHIIQDYKNDPIKYEAQLWLAHTKHADSKSGDVIDILVKALEDDEFSLKLRSETYALLADTYLQEKKIDQAIQYLEKALQEKTKKKHRIRYTYILAQLYSEIGDKTKATNYFSLIESMNPPYDMAFNAKINKATVYESGNSSSKDILTELNKLLRDEKNKEYKDQIYFAIANVHYADNNEEKALENYLNSVKYSTENQQQKAISFLSIGEIYYTQREYIKSEPYYDSCTQVLPKDYRNYSSIKQRSENLHILAKNYRMAEREDSLQTIARLSPEKRNELIDKKIKEVIEQEALAQQQKELDQLNAMLYNQEFGSMNQKLTGTFYFYNESAVKFGASEFKRIWSDRPLEDNWRRAAKTTDFADTEFDEENEESEETTTPTQQVSNNKSRSYYLQDLPLNDSLMKISTSKIEEGMFNTGMAYMNLIEDIPYAIQALEAYIARFSDEENAPIALYYLHELYVQEGKTEQAEQVKAKVIQNYAESNFAKALSDENFYKNYRTKNRELEKSYAECYRLFVKNDHSQVITSCKKLVQDYKDTYLQPKFEFLQAVSSGKLMGIETLKENLTTIVASYPNDEVTQIANSILTHLSSKESQETLQESLQAEKVEQSTIEIPKEKELYSQQNDTEEHLYIIVAKNEFVDIKKLHFNILNYNLDYFTNFNFTIEIKDLDKGYSMISIRPFSNKTQSMNYYELIEYNQEIYENIEKIFTAHATISATNYSVLLLDKNVETYMKFFDEQYEQ